MAARRCNRGRGGTPEGYVQSSVLALLQAKGVWHRRMQARTFLVPGKGGKTRPMFVGSVGMADILAMPRVMQEKLGFKIPVALWIECKAGKNTQNKEQREFEAEVVSEGHAYLVARSIEDVQEWLDVNGVGR